MAVPASDDCTSRWSIRCTQPAGTSGGGTITVPSGSPGGETIGPGGWLTRRVNREVGSNQAKSDVVDAGGGGSQTTKAAGSDGKARRGSGVTVIASTIQPTAGSSATVGGSSGVVMSGNDIAFIYSAPIALAR